MKVNIEAKFGNDIYCMIHVIIFGIICKTFKIPDKPKEKKKKKKKKKKVNIKTSEILRALIKNTKKYKIEYIAIGGDFGLGDAAATAIGTGLLYTVTGIFIGFLSDYFRLSKVKTKINPNYKTAVIQLYAQCILNLNIVNIISAAMRLLKLYLNKRKEKHYVKSSN